MSETEEQSEANFTDAVFRDQATYLIHFAARWFRQKIVFPENLMDVVPKMAQIMVSLVAGKASVGVTVVSLKWLKGEFESNQDFVKNIDEIIEKLQNGPDLATYAWELASDLVSFERNIMKYFESSLKVLGVEKEDLQTLLDDLAEFEERLPKNKPVNAKDPVEVSLDFTDPEVIKLYNGCAKGQVVSMPMCTVCQGRATWFAMPCSHPMYCDADKLEEGAEEFCCNEGCNAKIERLVRIED